MNLLRFILSYILESSTLMLAAFVSYDIAALFRNKWFITTKIPHRNTLKYIIFLEYKKPMYFSFFIACNFIFPHIEYVHSLCRQKEIKMNKMK